MAELRFAARIDTTELEQDSQKTKSILDGIVTQADKAGQGLDQLEARMVEHLGKITEALAEIGREMSAFEDYEGNILPDVDVEQYRALKQEFKEIQDLRRQQTDELQGVRSEIRDLEEYTRAVEEAQNTRSETARQTADDVSRANDVASNSNNELLNTYRQLSASAAEALSSIASSTASIGTEVGSSISGVRENIQTLEQNLEQAQTVYDQWLENTAELPFDLSSFEQVNAPLQQIKSQLTEQREELARLEQAQRQQADAASDAAISTARANDIAASSTDELIAKYKDITAEIDAEQRSLRLLEDQLKDINREIRRTPAGNDALGNLTNRDNLETQITQTRRGIADLAQTQEQYGQVLRKNGVDTDNLTQATVSFRTQVTQARDRLSELIASGNASNEEIREAEGEFQRLALVQREVANRQRALIDSFSGGQLQGAIQGVQALVGAYTAARGVVSIFTQDQEKQDAIQRQLAQGLSILVGVQQVSNALNQTSAFRINTVTRAQELWARANTRVATTLRISTTAASRLMAVLTGGLAIAIPVIIGLFQRWRNSQQELAEQQQQLREAQQQQVQSFRDSIGQGSAQVLAQFTVLQNKFRALSDDITSRNSFIKENADVFKQWGVDIRNATDADNLFVNNAQAFIDSVLARAEAMANFNLIVQRYQETAGLRAIDTTGLETAISKVQERITYLFSQGFDTTTANNQLGLLTNQLNAIQDPINKADEEIQQLLNNFTISSQRAADLLSGAGIGTIVNVEENKKLMAAIVRQYDKYQKQLTSLTQRNLNERQQLDRAALDSEEARIQFDLDLTLENINKERNALLGLVDTYNKLARATGREEIVADTSIFDRLTQNANATANAQLERNAQDTIRKNREYWSQYLREYGTFQERLTEITADYNNRIAEAQRQGLTGQVAILQQELQTAIANLNIEGFSDTLFGDLAGQSTNAINAAIQQAQTLITLLKQGAGNNPQLLEVIERLQDAIDNAQANVRGRLSTGLKGIAAPLRQASNLASQFSESLGNAIGYSATLLESIGGIAEGFENTKKSLSDFNTLLQSGTAGVGDIISGIGSIGGAIGGIIGGLTSIISLFDNSAKRDAENAQRRQAYQEATNKQLERYIELLDTASGHEYWDAQNDATQILENRIGVLIGQIHEIQRIKFSDVFFPELQGKSIDQLLELAQNDPEWLANANEDVRRILLEILDARQQVNDLGIDFTERLTQTTASDLESAIRDGLRGGMSGIDDLGNYFEEVMRDALIQSFLVDQGGRKAIQDFYDRYAALAEDGLTEAEIAELRAMWQTIIDNAKQAAGDIDELLGTSAEDSRTAVAQGIATASQDSVDELNGRFTVIQSHTYQMNQTTLEMLRLMGLNMANNNAMLDHVAAIHINTNRLMSIQDSLINIETRGLVMRTE